MRFIELMPIGHADVGESYGFISNQEILSRFPQLVPVKTRNTLVSDDFRLPDGKGKVGFISCPEQSFLRGVQQDPSPSDGKINRVFIPMKRSI